MSLTVNSHIVADARIDNVVLRDCAGASELTVYVSMQPTAPIDQMRWARIYAGRITMKNAAAQSLDLGDARTVAPVNLIQTKSVGKRFAELRLLLQPHQISRLEAMRGGGDLDLELELYGEGGVFSEGGEPSPVRETLRKRLDRSAWIKGLREAGALDILQLEVPMPAGEPRSLIADHLATAQRHYLQGDYRECVAACRLAIDDLGALGAAGFNGALRAFSNEREAMTKDDRVDALAGALRHLAHQAHHTESDGGHMAYGRADAALALAVAAALAAHRSGV